MDYCLSLIPHLPKALIVQSFRLRFWIDSRRYNWRPYGRNHWYLLPIFYARSINYWSVAVALYRRIQGNQLKNSWWFAFAISLPGTILSTIITVILFNEITSAGSSIIVQLLYGAGMSQSLAMFLAQVGTDYVDKLLTVIFVSVAGRLIGKRLSVIR